MNYILKKHKKVNCTKEIVKSIKYLIIIIFIIFMIIIGSYKPVYEIYLNDESIGFVSSKADFEKEIKDRILTVKDSNAVAIDLNTEPIYKYRLERFKRTNEEEILERLSNNITTTYRIYAINLNNTEISYVNTWEEAENIVKEMSEKYSAIDSNITVTEKFTNNIEELKVDELVEAKASVDNDLRIIQEEQEKIAKATFNGIYFSVKPVSGMITSRFGAVESIRNHVHKGMDIAAPAGTQIKAAANGTVIQAGWSGGYGNLIVIDHGNEVKSYYGHCNNIYVSVGQEVIAGDVIGAVGSTGNSTGNHLHFEIRSNDEQINPEEYIYR